MPAVGKPRNADYKFKASLGFIVRRPCLKKQNKTKNTSY
jgi:hypothetical protein